MTTHPAPKQSVTVELSFGRFTSPSCVKVVGARNNGTKFDAPSSLPLHEVSAENLSILCDYLREDIFALARKQDPRIDRERYVKRPSKAVEDGDDDPDTLSKKPFDPEGYQGLPGRAGSLHEEDDEEGEESWDIASVKPLVMNAP